LHKKALAIRRKALGEDHPDTAMSYANLAVLYYATGRYQRAEPLYEKALAIRHKTLGEEHPQTAEYHSSLAAVHAQMGQYARAARALGQQLGTAVSWYARHARSVARADLLPRLRQFLQSDPLLWVTSRSGAAGGAVYEAALRARELGPARDMALIDRGYRIRILDHVGQLLRSPVPLLGDVLVVASPDFDAQDTAAPRATAPPPAASAGAAISPMSGAVLSSAAAVALLRGTFMPVPVLERPALDAARLFGARLVPLVGPRAREADVKAALERARVAIFATHGFAVAAPEVARRRRSAVTQLIGQRMAAEGWWSDPYVRAGLALAGANRAVKGSETEAERQGEDGILLAAEVQALDLSGLHLASLMACETGRGDARAAEGVAGLRGAFLDAGAQAVLASHWRVSVAAAKVLMESFARHHRQDGHPAPEAWRRALLDVRRARPHPSHWAAFVLVGR
jgi:hypothetical protein